MHNGQGLPPRAGSEYEGDLYPYGADRYAPTDPRAFAARLDLITASEYEDALRACADMDDLHDLRACIAMMDLDDLRACIAMMGLLVSRIAVAPRRLAEYDACTLKAEMRAMRRAFDLRDEMRRSMYDLKTKMRRAKYDPKADKDARELEAQEERLRALDKELELWEAEDHIAFDAASRIQAGHSLAAQERPCAQEKDNAQYLEPRAGERRAAHPGGELCRHRRRGVRDGGVLRARDHRLREDLRRGAPGPLHLEVDRG